MLTTETTTDRSFRELVLEFLFLEEPAYYLPLDMVYIPGGILQTGKLSANIRPFYISKFPITQGQWWAVAGLNMSKSYIARRPSRYKLDWNYNHKNLHRNIIDPRYSWENLPVESISWADTVEFCERLSIATELHYRLPSLTEWLYCYQMGGQMPRIKDRLYGPFTVDHYPANALGLHSMGGNVWEWVADNWQEKLSDYPTDGSSYNAKWRDFERVLLGGCYKINDEPPPFLDGEPCMRGWANEMTVSKFFGFRVVITA